MRQVLKMNRPMYDPKFEKAVQQKMEELEFRPAESVWVNIEKAVVEDRRRRGAGFFWRFLLPGVVLVAAAGGYLHFFNGKTTAARNASGSQAGTTTARTGGSATADRDGAESGAEGNAATHKAESGAVSSVGQGSGVHGGQSQGIAGYEGRGGRNGRIRQRLHQGSQRRPSQGSQNGASQGYPGTGDENDGGEAVTTNGSREEAGKGSSTEKRDWSYMPGLVDLRLNPQVYGAALKTQKNGVSVKSLSQNNYHWEAGFAAGAGWSRLNKLNADQASAAVTRMAASLYNINGSSYSKNYISEVRPGASFEGGIYLQRPLSRRWLVNTGMYLHYYSNSISVGQQLSTYVNASSSYFTPTTLAASQGTTMYASGNQRSYTNRYYFLELPVGVQWKLSQNRILPVFLEGGVSLSRLMGADALFYNAKTGLYSKDGEVVNKTQFNISSALLFGLPFHGVRIQLGPQIQYGLTPLINTQGVGDQHFLYTGLRVVVIPGRR